MVAHPSTFNPAASRRKARKPPDPPHGANDYRSIVARGPLLDKVFALRYKSYSAENYIGQNKTERFMDEYDNKMNVASYLTIFRGKPIGSIRACVYTPDTPIKLPIMEPFEKQIDQELGFERPFVEANRFVVDPEFQRKGGIKARFNIFRNIIDHAMAVSASSVVAAVREEHVKFYRLLYFRELGDSKPKAYPGLNFKVVLLICDDLVKVQEFIWKKAG